LDHLDYYKESAMGTIITSYEKLTDNRFTDDTTVRNDFTNSGAYTVDTGLAVKTRTSSPPTRPSHGWYDKAGLSSLSERPLDPPLQGSGRQRSR
jgi:hypothetical protein